jgi:Protein of unknown function (DUF6044)
MASKASLSTSKGADAFGAIIGSRPERYFFPAIPNFLFLMTACLLIVVAAAFHLFGTHVGAYVHDQLDHRFSDIQAMLTEGKLFAGNLEVVEGFAGGIKRGFLEPETKFMVLVSWLFNDALSAYVVVNVLNVVFGAIAFVLFGREFEKHFGTIGADAAAGEDPTHLQVRTAIVVVAAVYAIILPLAVWNLAAVSLPLFWYGFLKTLSQPSIVRTVALGLVCALLGQFYFVSIFAYAVAFMLIVRDALRNGRWNGDLVVYLIVCCAFGALSEWRLFAQILLDPTVIHRTEYIDPSHFYIANVSDTLALIRFAVGQARATLLHGAEWHTAIPLALAFFFAAEALFTLRSGFRSLISYARDRILLVSPLVALVIPNFCQTVFGLPQAFPFQYNRFYSLIPFISAATALYVLVRPRKILSNAWLVVFVLASGTYTFAKNTKPLTLRSVVGIESVAAHKSYFEKNFDIQNDKVASIGMHPAIAIYSGLKVADGYHYYYPLAKKHDFAQMIEAEISMSPELMRYFHGWGNRMYFFSSEIKFDYNRPDLRYDKVISPRFDYSLMHRRGIRMILSRARISHPCLRPAAKSSVKGSYELFSYTILCR